MACELCEDKLLEYLYGELGEQDRLRMERHLKDSSACREVLDRYRSVRKAAAGMEDEELPAGLHTRILAHAEEARAKKARRPLRSWLFTPGLATVSVAAVAAVVYLHTVRTQGRLPLHDGPPAALRTHERAPEPAISEFRRPDALKELRDPEAREELFVRDLLPVSQEAVPPPEIKKAEPQTEGVPAGNDSRPPSAARAGSPKGYEAKGSGLGNDRLHRDGMGGSFQPPARAEPQPGAHPAAPVPPEAYGDLQGTGSPDPGRRTVRSAPPAAKQRTAAPSRGSPAPLESHAPDITEITDEEARKVPLERIGQLVAADRCEEARIWVYIYRAGGPALEQVGRAWMDVADCFHRKGREREAADAAREAAEIPSTTSEAQAFLQSLPHTGPPRD